MGSALARRSFSSCRGPRPPRTPPRGTRSSSLSGIRCHSNPYFKTGLRKPNNFQVCGKRKERRVCCASSEPLQTFTQQAAAPVPKKIGTFTNIFHDIAGTAYALNETTILIKGFNYDGEGPDAFFLGGTHGRPSKSGEVYLRVFSQVFIFLRKIYKSKFSHRGGDALSL